jgi:hypothetical protein
MRSIVLEVRQAVVDGIKTALNDESVSVTYGWQGSSDDARREQVFTNNARAEHEPAGLKTGRNFRNETMTFDIVVLAVGPAAKPEEVDARALDIGQVVEEFIADHKGNELGIFGLKWLFMTDMSLVNRIGQAADGDGSATELTYTVRYSARLT